MKLTEDQIVEAVSQYWVRHFVHKGCGSLCGNSGIVDTTATAITSQKILNGRWQFCFCPNGQVLRDVPAKF
jgi:hypothetical protein